MSEANTLVAIEPTELPKLFTAPELMEGALAKIEAEVRSHVFDCNTEEGRKGAKSLAYKIARSKTLLDDTGKELTEDARKAVAKINEIRKGITSRLDALRDEVKAPAEAWENQEAIRKEKIAALLASVMEDARWPLLNAAQLTAERDRILAVEVNDDWAEFKTEGEIAKRASVDRLYALIVEAEKAEAEKRELEELRAMKAEIERQKLEAQEAELARQREEARKEAEAERKAAAEIEMKRREEEAASRAREQERASIEKERQRQEAEAAKLAANKKHRKMVDDTVMDWLARHMTQTQARVALDQLITGECQFLKVDYNA